MQQNNSETSVHISVIKSPVIQSRNSWSSILMLFFLARSANLPEGLSILLALISSFFTMSKAISVSTAPIFTIFLPNGRYLREFSWTGPFFSDSSRDVAMATNLVAKMGQNYLPLHLSLCQSKTEWYIATSMCALTAQMMPLYRVKISWTSVQ